MNYSSNDLKSDITTLLEDYTNKEYIVSEIMYKIEFYEECKQKEAKKAIEKIKFWLTFHVKGIHKEDISEAIKQIE